MQLQQVTDANKGEAARPVGAPQAASVTSDLRDMLAVLLDSWQLVLAVVMAFFFIGLFRAWIAAPRYKAMSVVEVESRSSGSDYVQGADHKTFAAYAGANTIATEIEIIRSRSVLSEAVKAAGLDLVVQPRYLTAFGRSLAFRYHGSEPARPPLGLSSLSSYAWGGDKIEISAFNIPERYIEKKFVLVACDGGGFDLGVGGQQLISGAKRGEAVQGKLPDGEPFGIVVSTLVARPGTQFFVERLSIRHAVEALGRSLTIVQRGSLMPFANSILQLRIDGGDPTLVTRAANAVASAYSNWNVRNLSQEATRKLDFLNSQLPKVQADEAAADLALAEFRSQSPALVISDAARNVLEQSVALEQKLHEIEAQQALLSESVTSAHPLMQSLDKEHERLSGQRDALNKRLTQLPASQLKLLQLTRNSEVTGRLHEYLMNQIQEIRLVKAGTVGNVQIIDSALLPEAASGPSRLGILMMWVVVGGILGSAGAVLRRMFMLGVDRPEAIESLLRIPLFGVIPHSESEHLAGRDGRRTSAPSPGLLLAQMDSSDSAIEGLRSLRVALQFIPHESKCRIVALTGPAPRVGKSFISSNLAVTLTGTQERVLIIDGDMRRGTLARRFQLPRSSGLSEWLSGQAGLDQIITTVNPFLSIVVCGKTPPNPAELLSSTKMDELLAYGQANFDWVVLDTPPIMNLADGVLLCRRAMTTLLVVRHRITSAGEAHDCIRRCTASGIEIKGAIFNDYKPSASSYLRSTYGRHYYYSKYGRYGKAS